MVITLILIDVFLLADILTKYFAELYILPGQVIESIPGTLNLTLTYNTGAAWGMFENNTLPLAILSLIASIAIIFFVVKNDWKNKKLYSLSTCMLLAGTFGNMIDRFLTSFGIRKGVVDMIDFIPLNWINGKINGQSFPTFNVADAFLVVGVIILAIDILFLEERRNKKHGKNSSK